MSPNRGPGRGSGDTDPASDAIAARVAHLRRLQALRSAVEAYEAEHGEITDGEIAAVRRADRATAIVVRGHPGVA